MHEYIYICSSICKINFKSVCALSKTICNKVSSGTGIICCLNFSTSCALSRCLPLSLSLLSLYAACADELCGLIFFLSVFFSPSGFCLKQIALHLQFKFNPKLFPGSWVGAAGNRSYSFCLSDLCFSIFTCHPLPSAIPPPPSCRVHCTPAAAAAT